MQGEIPAAERNGELKTDIPEERPVSLDDHSDNGNREDSEPDDAASENEPEFPQGVQAVTRGIKPGNASEKVG